MGRAPREGEGRPRRKEEPSDVDVRTRCTKHEKASWTRCAELHGLTLSEWVRIALTTQEVKDVRETQRQL